VENYIVRIYRFKEDRPKHLVGVVEEVGVKGKKAFNTYDELWEILNSRKKRVSHEKRKKREGLGEII
jgi:hypothetical protein